MKRAGNETIAQFELYWARKELRRAYERVASWDEDELELALWDLENAHNRVLRAANFVRGRIKEVKSK